MSGGLAGQDFKECEKGGRGIDCGQVMYDCRFPGFASR